MDPNGSGHDYTYPHEVGYDPERSVFSPDGYPNSHVDILRLTTHEHDQGALPLHQGIYSPPNTPERAWPTGSFRPLQTFGFQPLSPTAEYSDSEEEQEDQVTHSDTDDEEANSTGDDPAKTHNVDDNDDDAVPNPDCENSKQKQAWYAQCFAFLLYYWRNRLSPATKAAIICAGIALVITVLALTIMFIDSQTAGLGSALFTPFMSHLATFALETAFTLNIPVVLSDVFIIGLCILAPPLICGLAGYGLGRVKYNKPLYITALALSIAFVIGASIGLSILTAGGFAVGPILVATVLGAIYGLTIAVSVSVTDVQPQNKIIFDENEDIQDDFMVGLNDYPMEPLLALTAEDLKRMAEQRTDAPDKYLDDETGPGDDLTGRKARSDTDESTAHFDSLTSQPVDTASIVDLAEKTSSLQRSKGQGNSLPVSSTPH